MTPVRLCVECGRMRPVESFESEKSKLCDNCEPSELIGKIAAPAALPVQPPSPNGGISVEEAATMLTLSKDSVRNAARAGKIRVLDKGPNKTSAITLDRLSVENYRSTKGKGRKAGRKPKSEAVRVVEKVEQVKQVEHVEDAGGLMAALQERMELHKGLVEHYEKVLEDMGGVSANGNGRQAGL